jgi:taurine dioxygenase
MDGLAATKEAATTEAGAKAAGITVRRIGAALGAEIQGVDLAKPLDAATVETIKRALGEHLVIVFRDQDVPPAAQIAFTRNFGKVEPHPLYKSAQIPGYPEILVLEHKAGQFFNGRNDIWHADVTFLEAPALGSVLHCKAIEEGYGDTLFANVQRAYERLSPGLQKLLSGMKALHSAALLQKRNNRDAYNVEIKEIAPPVAHPVVRTDPKTGRKGLFVNPAFTERFVDMTEAESKPLLDYLYAFVPQPEQVYRHRWRVGDVVMFENRCVWHYVSVDYPPEMHRRMHRTTASGERIV